MADPIEIRICNWEKYQKRKDIKAPWWFALSNRLIEDADFFDFTAIEFKAWIYILSQASQKRSPKVLLNSAHANHVCKIPPKDLLSCVKKLIKLGVCKAPKEEPYAIRTESVRDPVATLQDKTEQDKTEQDKTEQDKTEHDISSEVKSPQRQHLLPEIEYFLNIKEISDDLIAAWRESYGDDWLKAELSKAKIWCLANPKKKPKSPGPFLTNWFSRGWEQSRKAVPTMKKPELDFSKLVKRREDLVP